MLELPQGDARQDQSSSTEISKEHIEQIALWDTQMCRDLDALIDVI